MRTQAYGMFPVSPDWNVTITPNSLELEPNQTSQVVVAVEHSSAFAGTQPFNIHGFATAPAGPRALLGGVTLNAQGD